MNFLRFSGRLFHGAPLYLISVQIKILKSPSHPSVQLSAGLRQTYHDIVLPDFLFVSAEVTNTEFYRTVFLQNQGIEKKLVLRRGAVSRNLSKIKQ